MQCDFYESHTKAEIMRSTNQELRNNELYADKEHELYV
jgi:hypothetical protein